MRPRFIPDLQSVLNLAPGDFFTDFLRSAFEDSPSTPAEAPFAILPVQSHSSQDAVLSGAQNSSDDDVAAA